MAGDEASFEGIVSLYRRGLTLFINGYVNHMGEAEELMIDAFAQLAVNRKRFEGNSSLKTYLYAIGRNLALHHVKKRMRFVAEEGAQGPSPETEYLREERDRRLYDGIKALKREHGEVLYLLYFEDMSYAEAGRVLKKTAPQVGSLAYRAKTALKTQLEHGGFTYP